MDKGKFILCSVCDGKAVLSESGFDWAIYLCSVCAAELLLIAVNNYGIKIKDMRREERDEKGVEIFKVSLH